MKAEPVPVETEHIKLDSFLKLCAAASTGGHAKLMVSAGEVLVNGEICRMRGKKLRPGDRVTCGDKTYEVTGGAR